MLELILGRAGTGKTTLLRKNLAESTAQKTVLIVPEQYTFESERALLTEYGAEIANRVQVYSFTRLAQAAFLRYGGGAGKRLTDGGRRILMTLALENCADRLTLFEKSAERMTDVLLNTVGEMKICGIEPDMLTKTADAVTEDSLSRKLREIALIYGTYEALVAQTYLDPLDDLTRLDDLLSAHPDFFENAYVAVDAFDGFTVQEYKILRHALCRAEKVSVTLCCDDLDTSRRDLFSTVRRTASRLTRLAKENAVGVLSPIYLKTPHRFKNAELCAAESTYASFVQQAETAENVCVYRAASPYEEADFTAAKIRDLVLHEGYRYRDISVVCRDGERYTRLFAAALRRWEIPAFLSEARSVDAEPLMRFVLSAFQVVSGTRKWYSEDVLSMLKTGITNFTAEELALLENYIYTWKLNGVSSWCSPFTKHPDGFGKPMDDAASETLNTLNMLRERVTAPLLKFSERITNTTGEKISEAVYKLLMDFNLEESFPVFCRTLESAGRDDLSAAQMRIWDLLMEVLDQMAGVLGEQTITGEKYGRLLKEIVSGEDVSDIPQSMDSITFGTADRIRQSAPRAVFLLGAVQGEFPLIPSVNGVFSEPERRALLALELPVSDVLEDRMLQEKYLAYAALCGASEKLYLTYPVSVGQEAKSPGELIGTVELALPHLKVTQNLPPEFFANAPEAAFSQTASLFHENTTVSETLKSVFREKPDYNGRLNVLGGTDRMASACLDPDTAKEYFGGGHYFSASQIEVYHQCRFKYFCRYGLGAKERRPAEIDALEYGSLMHYLFEKTLSRAEDIGTLYLDPDGLKKRVHTCIMEYVSENMGGYDSLSPREKYRLYRMEQTAVKLIAHISKEMANSLFRPAHFELELKNGTPYPPLRIPTKNGLVTVGGIIDRVDVYKNDDGVSYVRVVDYKTGRKEFKLADVLYGMSLQMLIYLAALTQNKDLHPAGILYMPAFIASVTSDKTESADKLKQESEKNLRMNGLILDDLEIENAMEIGLSGRFIPVYLTKTKRMSGKDSALQEPALQLVLRYVERLIATMAEELAKGDIMAKPLMQQINACAWCPYTSVCGSEHASDDAEKRSVKNAEALARMENDLENHTTETEGSGEYA